ncbi:unnamed protein product [Vicia faba]|uniref:Glycoside hydrolase family 38 central domain-containing protein n=1 Tax=Vicia faba TaxID=3906 RepID=A0AAV0YYJ8_VICFA|nr:unnamed protein product [Vicia faba]
MEQNAAKFELIILGASTWSLGRGLLVTLLRMNWRFLVWRMRKICRRLEGLEQGEELGVRYANHPNAYWTGYVTSRPTLKGYVRAMSGYYQAAKQLEFFKGRNESGPNTDALADALALTQHHDVVSGTERQHVAADYANALQFLNLQAEGLVTSALALLVNQRLSSHKINPFPL